MRRMWLVGLQCLVAILVTEATLGAEGRYPKFEVDPSFPKQLPNNYVMGSVGGVAVDSRDHVWVVARQRSLDGSVVVGLADNPPSSICCRHAPTVMEFDPAGNFIQGWGGRYTPTADADKYQWPQSEHGITVDYKGNVWICGYGNNREAKIDDNHCLKFTRDGNFLLQIGTPNQSKGSLDPLNSNHATQVQVWPKTNEAFIADGYVNRRVVVHHADTGQFKRLWGAYGNKPDDSIPRTRVFDGPGPPQFNNVHGIAISNDGLVYVNDRQNNRVQVFTTEGKFLKEVFVARNTVNNRGTSHGSAFSPDKEQRFLYVSDPPNFKVRVFDRQSLQEIPEAAFGTAGLHPGQFIRLHGIAADSKGNVYTGEVIDGAGGRVQKFAFKGMAP